MPATMPPAPSALMDPPQHLTMLSEPPQNMFAGPLVPSPSTTAAASALFQVTSASGSSNNSASAPMMMFMRRNQQRRRSSTSSTSSSGGAAAVAATYFYQQQQKAGSEADAASTPMGSDDENDDEDLDDMDDLEDSLVGPAGGNQMMDMSGMESSSAQSAASTTDTATRPATGTNESAAVVAPPPVVRKRNVGVPKFLRFLFQMLEMEDRAVIAWSHAGTAFQIRQPEELAEHILPKYFKHNKVSSFQRQLNYFGFKKWTKTQTNICTFSHPFFLRDDRDRMQLIKRKERVAAASSATTSTIDTSTMTAKDAAMARARAAIKAPMGAEAFLRRHSTGTLPSADDIIRAIGGGGPNGVAKNGGEPLGPNGAMKIPTRKRAGTIDIDHAHQIRKFATAREPMMAAMAAGRQSGNPSAAAARLRNKRKSLPQLDPYSRSLDLKGGHNSAREAFMNELARQHSSRSAFGANNGAASASNLSAYSLYFNNNAAMKPEASMVHPVSAEAMMQHAYQPRNPASQQQPGFYGNSKSHDREMEDASMDMSDLSGPLQTTASWAANPTANANNYPLVVPAQRDVNNMMLMMPYKTANGGGYPSQQQCPTFDSMSMMEYSSSNPSMLMNNQAPLHHQLSYLALQQQQQQQQQPQPSPSKDFIDVLLESAAMDDHLGSQGNGASSASLTGSWDPNQFTAQSNMTPSYGQLGQLQMPQGLQDAHKQTGGGQRF